MKVARYIYIALLCGLVLWSGGRIPAVGQRAKKVRTQRVTKSSSARKTASGRRSSSSAKTTSGKKGRQRGAVSARRAVARMVNFEAVRQERRHLDSLRLHNGGARPLAPVKELLPVDIEPLMMRFRRGDTTLRSEVIAQLYYSNHAKPGADSFLQQIESEADRSIASSRYAEALGVVRRGLLRNPMYLALIKRACDLAQHEGDSELEIYLWQLIELFVVVEESGDGATPNTAFDVMGISDALLFETLWMETPRERIRRRDPVRLEGDKQLLVMEISSGEGKTTLRHYRMPDQQ